MVVRRGGVRDTARSDTSDLIHKRSHAIRLLQSKAGAACIGASDLNAAKTLTDAQGYIRALVSQESLTACSSFVRLLPSLVIGGSYGASRSAMVKERCRQVWARTG